MSEQSQGRWQTYLWDGLLLLVLCLLFFWRDLTPNPADQVGFAAGDFADQFYAFARYEASRLQAGQLPLWNPFTYAGHPFLADVQAAVFYPISLLNVWATNVISQGDFPYRALVLEALLHYPLAAFFAYLLGRRLTGSRTGGLVASVIFTFGGYLTSYPPLQLAVLEVQVWLPLILLLLDVAAVRLTADDRAGAGRWIIGAGLVLGVSTLAGHPQSTLLVVYLTVIFALFRLFLPWRSGMGWRYAALRIGLVLAFLGIGFGVAAVQILPSLEFMLQSTRAGTSFEEMGGGFTPYDLIQLILPAVGVPVPALYVGVLPLGLAAAALIRYLALRDAERKPLSQDPLALMVAFWGIVGLLGLLLSFGKHLPLYQVFYLLAPGWRLFRQQERTVVWMVLALALLAGYGAAWLNGLRAARQTKDTRDREERIARGLVWAYGIATLAALVLAAVFFVGYQFGQDQLWGFVAATLFLALMLGLSALVLRSRQPWLLLGLIVLDLFTIAPASHRGQAFDNPFPPLAVLAEPLADTETFRIANEDQLPGNAGVIYGLEDLGGASPLKLASYQALLDRVPSTRIWQLLNVEYVVTWRESLDQPAERIAQGSSGDGRTAYLYRLAAPGPRAWLVGQVVIEPDGERLWQRLAADDFDPAQQVLLPASLAGTNFRADSGSCQGEVVWLEREPEHVRLEVNVDQPCVLVLGELVYPGWRAMVDGADAPILRANGLLRALALDAGSHQVAMDFRPLSVTLGALLSLATLLLAGVALALLGRRSRRAEQAGKASQAD